MRVTPVVLENRVKALIEILPVAQERLSEDALLDGADLQQRAVAAAVLHCRARLEPMDAERVERELENQLGALLKNAGAPERRADRESPFRGVETRLGLAHLEDPDRRVEPLSVTAKQA